MILFNCKGIAYKWLFRLPVVVAYTTMIIVFYLLYVNQSIDIDPLRNFVIQQSVLHAKEGIIYEDEVIHRAYPYVVDRYKFTDEILNAYYDRGQVESALAIEITNLQTEEVETHYSDEYWYDRYRRRELFESEPVYVLLYNGQSFVPAILKVSEARET